MRPIRKGPWTIALAHPALAIFRVDYKGAEMFTGTLGEWLKLARLIGKAELWSARRRKP